MDYNNNVLPIIEEIQRAGTTSRNAIAAELNHRKRQVSQAYWLGRGEHRRDPDLLPPAAGTPQTHEVDQLAGTPQRGNQAAHLRGANLPQCRELFAARPRPFAMPGPDLECDDVDVRRGSSWWRAKRSPSLTRRWRCPVTHEAKFIVRRS
jgi:hypothetical protein